MLDWNWCVQASNVNKIQETFSKMCKNGEFLVNYSELISTYLRQVKVFLYTISFLRVQFAQFIYTTWYWNTTKSQRIDILVSKFPSFHWHRNSATNPIPRIHKPDTKCHFNQLVKRQNFEVKCLICRPVGYFMLNFHTAEWFHIIIDINKRFCTMMTTILYIKYCLQIFTTEPIIMRKQSLWLLFRNREDNHKWQVFSFSSKKIFSNGICCFFFAWIKFGQK